MYKVAQHTQSAGQCAALCASDASCVAWTRVAGGRSDVRSCHLKRSLSGLAGSPEASMSVQQRAQVGTYCSPCPSDLLSQNSQSATSVLRQRPCWRMSLV